jgi:hypothetical protein
VLQDFSIERMAEKLLVEFQDLCARASGVAIAGPVLLSNLKSPS